LDGKRRTIKEERKNKIEGGEEEEWKMRNSTTTLVSVSSK
jgi:hypothetical protein